jgi:hypothetical protein
MQSIHNMQKIVKYVLSTEICQICKFNHKILDGEIIIYYVPYQHRFAIENTEKSYTVFVNHVARLKNKSPIHTPECVNPWSFP